MFYISLLLCDPENLINDYRTFLDHSKTRLYNFNIAY